MARYTIFLSVILRRFSCQLVLIFLLGVQKKGLSCIELFSCDDTLHRLGNHHESLTKFEFFTSATFR